MNPIARRARRNQRRLCGLGMVVIIDHDERCIT
jgi:hypothetical protein